MEEQGFIESREEMEKMLREEELGYLGMSLEGKPYVVPLIIIILMERSIFIADLRGRNWFA